jgi:hypothetical protein
MAGHSNVKTTDLYDRRGDEVSFSEIEVWGFKNAGEGRRATDFCVSVPNDAQMNN